MSLRRGFKKEANQYARDFRQELGLAFHAPLCPFALAKHLAIDVLKLSSFEHDKPDAVHHLMKTEPKSFSAGTVFHGLKRLIVFNDSHSKGRQAANVIHELAHGILGHPPSVPFSEFGCRNFNKEIEEEANWLGPALLVSEEAALHIVQESMNENDAAEHYGCTTSVIKLRTNMTGAYKRRRRNL